MEKERVKSGNYLLLKSSCSEYPVNKFDWPDFKFLHTIFKLFGKLVHFFKLYVYQRTSISRD